ncbi:MAG: ABC transporter substrate-binding protein [Acidimicrobiia bacterium]|nr:ABC transporter substrate-binding protein [Acidimicrobiia bacterium]MDH5521814.1 ABC transporter substrate-binding protein [Acidimicrobiia bacterium]
MRHENHGMSNRGTLWRRWIAVLMAAGMILAACGSDGDDTSADETTDTTAADDTASNDTADDAEADDASDDTAVDSGDEAASGDLQTIRLVTWGAKFIDFIDLYVGEENGYFADAGVQIEQLAGAGAGDAIFQLVGGNADIAMADPFSGFFAINAGDDLEGFYCPYTQNWLTMLVNTSAGIESPEDLRGKTIAVTSQASTSKWYASLLLAANGITEDDVTFAATGVDFGTALLAGEAQAASTWGSVNWGLLENGGIPEDQVGDYEIWQYDQVPGPNDVYFAKREWLDENDELVGRFIDALEQAKLWIEENPDEAAEIGSRYADGAENLERNRAVIDYRIEMQNNGPGVAEHGMGWCDPDTIADVAQQGVDLGILEQSVDVPSIITNRYIDG